MAALCSLSTAAPDFYSDKENVLQAEGFGNEKIKESNLSKWAENFIRLSFL